ncbi:cation:proton antiporter [Desertifilum sp. FACHB-1129]|uniref:Sodium:proton antiporter n=1 Tax=Desertifilum tharense IPPAS B-1220 TaxID=1781255 RepID=A0A1E5QKL5_9CYAN|nr:MULTISPECIES: cation:proton antiporter [Desertifilum]MDA0211125.1 cation:proton antiporter [Cyanobacteria bacterium FC1]MBD2314139.1 cation:proton antiporter [Desertifilum sp. FACHB-1129]MBD2320104.1 cation:proton antiporter [Desertifilum sp. FACHB-866]MBD2330232.1 cation:proton antiporter [Desertifilum sp. FACHB-868]OEJ75134.1 sodium:proton antiporter [Desertifilum tharense IPPAS B-1220]
MLASALWILLMGFFAGQLARRLGAPPLIGMILIGIAIGPQLGNLISPEVLDAADDLRLVAVMIILMKAGLGLDREKLAQQGTVALRLGFLPASVEAVVVAIASIFLFNFDFLTGLLLGCVVGAESPAVIVPGMLRLKSQGWGVVKGIPDAILTGSALSDVLLLLVFGLLMNFLGQEDVEAVSLPGGLSLTPLQLLPFQALLEIGLGLVAGWVAAQLLVLLLVKQNWTRTIVQDTIIAASVALFLVIFTNVFPYYSGYLAVMAMGFFLIELDAPLARLIRSGFDVLWAVAEIVLFVLLGASIQLQVLGDVLLPGLLLLAIGLGLGRGIGWYLSTLGSNWTGKEKAFLLPGNMAKATVQAAIGALPLAAGIEGGEIILAIAALSILTTAPIGAWATQVFAPKLLEKGEVDPTKVAVTGRPIFLAAVDPSPLASPVLLKAADLARRSNGEVIVLYVNNLGDNDAVNELRNKAQKLLADIRFEFLTVSGAVPEEIVRVAQARQVTDIIIGKRGDRSLDAILIGSISQSVLEMSPIPVMTVDSPKA